MKRTKLHGCVVIRKICLICVAGTVVFCYSLWPLCGAPIMISELHLYMFTDQACTLPLWWWCFPIVFMGVASL